MVALPSDCNLRRKASSYSVATPSGYFLKMLDRDSDERDVSEDAARGLETG